MSLPRVDVFEASRLVKAGQVVAFPTETVYGLGAGALDPVAVAKIFEIKHRPLDHPLIVHIADTEDMNPLVASVPPAAALLGKTFWPGPLTLILRRSSLVPDLVTGGRDTVGIRIPNHPLALELIRLSGPIAAPSANPFGTISPTTPEHVDFSLGHSEVALLDGGPCSIGVESTIVSLLEATPRVLRFGGIAFESLQKVLGQVALPEALPSIAPGMLKHHYMPRTPLTFVPKGTSVEEVPPNAGAIVLRETPKGKSFSSVETLSPSGDLRIAALNLFAAMRRLDQKNLDCLFAFAVPDEGLGRAINERLKKAAL